ncbi:NAD(P) transhydrogenase subunit beta [Thermogutta terrifontis]|uniref:NAD(P) transhydrogenase subunit beta n=1 Tax=Thermogutta terrifontis TaxID=1331910 RepID=A0A286RFT7_9BACT|nr:NAD(P)(+) transhydrogenase (Re/Si-specific) subunit beta [Thermogutta terrifontis]ASV74802.1 NAD(P) transhydrogenase subunit beta [Thermogutta terrifontis]
MIPESVIVLAYLLASVLFILGIKGLTHPRTAVRGNLTGALGMLIAVLATLFHSGIIEYHWIILGLIVGSVMGAVLALKVRMTAMPQMVALLNGFGGAASVLVAAAELIRTPPPPVSDIAIATFASAIIGAVTFWGSLLAFAKLQEYKAFREPIRYPLLQPINAVLGILALGASVLGVLDPSAPGWYWVVVALSSVLGLTLVNPIGGADMPVVIALLNSYSGLAAAATGFVLGNAVLIISGSLVGASGIILTNIMCKAMNRSMFNVLFGVLQEGEQAAKADEVYRTVKSATAEEIAMLFDTARRVVIVPGYGMAVAQAQHAVRDLYHLLESRGIEVLFGIHPVAGRMPGHMNVLLAEVEIPYDKLKELDEINAILNETDVAIVLGANDVVNPLAKTDPKSPIAGMPIIEVDKAKTVVVIKRSLSPGFANIPNPLFAAPNTLMFFADGKRAVLDLVAAIKES